MQYITLYATMNYTNLNADCSTSTGTLYSPARNNRSGHSHRRCTAFFKLILCTFM